MEGTETLSITLTGIESSTPGVTIDGGADSATIDILDDDVAAAASSQVTSIDIEVSLIRPEQDSIAVQDAAAGRGDREASLPVATMTRVVKHPDIVNPKLYRLIRSEATVLSTGLLTLPESLTVVGREGSEVLWPKHSIGAGDQQREGHNVISASDEKLSRRLERPWHNHTSHDDNNRPRPVSQAAVERVFAGRQRGATRRLRDARRSAAEDVLHQVQRMPIGDWKAAVDKTFENETRWIG